MNAGLAGAELEEYTRLQMQEYAREIQRKFAEYLLDEAGTTVTVKRCDTDAMLDVLHELSHAGFTVNPDEDGYAPPQFFVHPADFHVFRDGLETYARITDSASIECYESEIHADHTFDEGTGIAIHPAAIVPSLPGDIERPYYIRHADGVIAIQMLTSP